MDDEDEVRDLNLSSRPLREERRRLRERGRLERGMARTHHHPTEHSNSEPGNAWTASQRQISAPPSRKKQKRRDPEDSASSRHEQENRCTTEGL